MTRLFDLEARGTTVVREVRGGLATFLTMAYILVANPSILAAGGVPYEAAVAATAAAAALCTLLVGVGADFPLALAPGMGLNAIIAFQIAPGHWSRHRPFHRTDRRGEQIQDGGGQIPRLRRILGIDAASAAIGGFFGASSVTSYIESAAGVAEGARTGLHSVVVATCFGLAVFAAPIAAIVPAAATAPALILVGCLMAQQITRIDFAALETAIPAFVLLVTIPFTWSISHGIGYGFLTYVVIQVLSGRWRTVHPVMYGTAAAFAGYFWLG